MPDEGYSWKKYLGANWPVLWGNSILRRALYAITKNGSFTINISGVPGSGKSTLQRHLSYKLYGNWRIAYLARIQTKEELASAIETFKTDKRFWISYEGNVIKRLPHADIDDKGTLFPSSVGNTKEMAGWHEWYMTRRSDYGSSAGSSPMSSDVRKRLRIGADAEIICYNSLSPDGTARYYGRYYEFVYHSKWHDSDNVYLSKNYVCDLTWPQLPRDVLSMELMKRSELSNYLRQQARISQNSEDLAKVLVFDKDMGLMNMQMEIVDIIRDKSQSRGYVDSRTLNDSYSASFNVKRDSVWMNDQIKKLVKLGVIKHRTNGSSNGWIELTEVGRHVSDLIHNQKEIPNSSNSGNTPEQPTNRFDQLGVSK